MSCTGEDGRLGSIHPCYERPEDTGKEQCLAEDGPQIGDGNPTVGGIAVTSTIANLRREYHAGGRHPPEVKVYGGEITTAGVIVHEITAITETRLWTCSVGRAWGVSVLARK